MVSQEDKRFNRNFERFCKRIGIAIKDIPKLRDKNENFLRLKEWFYGRTEN
jgi:hypothetical protein